MTITLINFVDEDGEHADWPTGISYTQKWLVYFTGTYNATDILYGTNVTTIPNGTASITLTLPKKNSTHPNDANAYVADIQVKLADGEGAVGDPAGSGVASYTVKYAQKRIDFDPDPLNRPPIISGGGSDMSETPIKDINGLPLVNSAGDLYNGLPERPLRNASEISITRNEGTNPASAAETYSNTTNNAAWYGNGIGTCLFAKISWNKKFEIVNGINQIFWEVNYPIRIKEDGWRLKPFDNGWNRIDSVTGSSRAITDEFNHRPTMAALLDGSGEPLNGDGRLHGTSGASAVIYPTNGNPSGHVGDGYEILDETNWATLSLPNPYV
jgi:hypothetical protein